MLGVLVYTLAEQNYYILYIYLNNLPTLVLNHDDKDKKRLKSCKRLTMPFGFHLNLRPIAAAVDNINAKKVIIK